MKPHGLPREMLVEASIFFIERRKMKQEKVFLLLKHRVSPFGGGWIEFGSVLYEQYWFYAVGVLERFCWIAVVFERRLRDLLEMTVQVQMDGSRLQSGSPAGQGGGGGQVEW